MPPSFEPGAGFVLKAESTSLIFVKAWLALTFSSAFHRHQRIRTPPPLRARSTWRTFIADQSLRGRRAEPRTALPWMRNCVRLISGSSTQPLSAHITILSTMMVHRTRLFWEIQKVVYPCLLGRAIPVSCCCHCCPSPHVVNASLLAAQGEAKPPVRF